MTLAKAAILECLQKDILPLQGYKPPCKQDAVKVPLGVINEAFPNKSFPIGAVHEFISQSPEDMAATTGFISGIVASLMCNQSAAVWISRNIQVFPPALKGFGISPDKVIFIKIKKDKDILWATEEALKCQGLSAVIVQLPELSFTESRRLQLAVEQSQVTAFIVRHNPKSVNTTACITRWKISSLSSLNGKDLPGVGFPCWTVDLQKVRNGRPGNWQIQFVAGRFKELAKLNLVHSIQKRKAG